MNEQRIEQLISHAIDGKLDESEWDEFAQAAQSDTSLWLRLAKAYEDHRALAETMQHVGAVAERIDLPQPAAVSAPRDAMQVDENVEARPGVLAQIRSVSAWMGWAVAALLAIAWLWQPLTASAPGTDPGSSQVQPVVQSASIDSPEDALQWYLKQGREQGTVVGELPERVLVDQRPVENGQGYELLYVRQILERTRVESLYQFAGQDESGRPSLVQPVNLTSPSM